MVLKWFILTGFKCQSWLWFVYILGVSALGEKGISDAWVESVSAAVLLPTQHRTKQLSVTCPTFSHLCFGPWATHTDTSCWMTSGCLHTSSGWWRWSQPQRLSLWDLRGLRWSDSRRCSICHTYDSHYLLLVCVLTHDRLVPVDFVAPSGCYLPHNSYYLY